MHLHCFCDFLFKGDRQGGTCWTRYSVTVVVDTLRGVDLFIVAFDIVEQNIDIQVGLRIGLEVLIVRGHVCISGSMDRLGEYHKKDRTRKEKTRRGKK
jgi:hypothetical protein